MGRCAEVGWQTMDLCTVCPVCPVCVVVVEGAGDGEVISTLWKHDDIHPENVRDETMPSH